MLFSVSCSVLAQTGGVEAVEGRVGALGDVPGEAAVEDNRLTVREAALSTEDI